MVSTKYIVFNVSPYPPGFRSYTRYIQVSVFYQVILDMPYKIEYFDFNRYIQENITGEGRCLALNMR